VIWLTNDRVAEEETFNVEVEETKEHILSGTYFLHLIYLQSLKAPHTAIAAGNAKDGILSLQIAADQAMRIAISVKKVDKAEMDKAVNDFEKTIKNDSELAKQYKRSNFILGYILEESYERAPKKADLML